MRERAAKEVALREALNAEIEALETKKNMELAQLTIKYAEKQDAATKKQQDEKKRAEDEVLRTQMDVLNKEDEIRQLQIDQMDVSENEKTAKPSSAQRLSLQCNAACIRKK